MRVGVRVRVFGCVVWVRRECVVGVLVWVGVGLRVFWVCVRVCACVCACVCVLIVGE